MIKFLSGLKKWLDMSNIVWGTCNQNFTLHRQFRTTDRKVRLTDVSRDVFNIYFREI